MENIINKIQKLLALAESAEKIGSLAEGENAMRQVNKLLLLHNIEMDSISIKEENPIKEVGDDALNFKCNQAGNQWKKDLLAVLVSHNLCRATFNSWSGNLFVIGKRENIEVVIYLYKFIQPRLLKMAQSYHINLNKDIKENINRRKILQSYLIGATKGINQKLEAEKAQFEDKEALAGLILSNNSLIEEFMNELGIKNAKDRKLSIFDDVSRHGREDGNKLQITKGLEGVKQTMESIKRLN